MPESSATKPFAMRSFVTFMVTWSFLAVVVTGVVLFVVPQGRIANWVEWRLLGLTKESWTNIHNAFAFIFIVAGALHLFPYNWKQWKSYLAKRAGNRLDLRRPKKEFVLSVAAGVAILAAAVGEWRPVRYLFDAGALAKDSWVVSAELAAPYGHAEESSLAAFAKRQNIDLDEAMEALRRSGFAVADGSESLGRIGAAAHTSAMAVYAVLKPLEKRPAGPAQASYTAEQVEQQFEGTGVGRKTVAEMCGTAGVDLAMALERLAARGFASAPDQTLKSIADAARVTPTDVLKTMLIGNPAATAR